ncbi:MAG: oligopeptide transporter permease protein [Cyanobacteria bacterium RYN_339]|nr:oligopeptide transporter permease protein [Cyanobacteria bacterium RYN_339]
MGRYLIRRLLVSIPLLIGVSLILYFLMRAAPGGPEAIYGQNPHMRAEDIERMKKLMGLNDPIPVAYAKWLFQFIQGNLGYSLFTGKTVASMLWERVPNTVLLMGASTLLSLVIGVGIGVISAIRQYSKFDYAVTTFSFFGYSMPTFWFGILMMMFFSANEYTIGGVTVGHWLPAAGMFSAGFEGSFKDLLWAPTLAGYLDLGAHLVLPTAVLCIVSIASWSRFSRSSMLEVIRMDYIRMARAKGLSERVVIGKHALRNGMIPVITIVALALPGLFAGATITEQIFAWPGVGRLFIDSLSKSDYPVVMAIMFISATLVVFSNLLADVLYAALDPRIRFN